MVDLTVEDERKRQEVQLRKIAGEVSKAIAVCQNIEKFDRSDVVSLLGYQTDLMAALTRIPEWYAEAEYIFNYRRGCEMDSLGTDISAVRLKIILESRMAQETRLLTYVHETGRAINKLLESLNVKIPTERRLMPNKS